jgi:hypothetical protein
MSETTTQPEVKEVAIEATEQKKESAIEQERPLTEGFVYMDNVKSILDVAMATKRNVILFGNGGYGKSEYSLAYLQEKGIDPYIITMGTGMTTDRMFGGLDIPVFNATGKIEYLVENCFMNHKYVIFEELFDAPDFILEQLKDILSSGVFRNGSQVYPIKTELIICCTNKSREDFAKNTSLKALMERFPLEANVGWKDHTKINYEHLFKTKMGFTDPFLPYLLEMYSKAGIKVSPRIAIIAAEIMMECGPDALAHVAELNKKPDLLKEAATKFKSIREVQVLGKEMQEMAEQLITATLVSLDEIKGIKSMLKTFLAKLTKLKTIKADDSIVATTTSMIKAYDKVYTEVNKKITIALAMEDDVLSVDESTLNSPSEITNFELGSHE